MNVNMLDIIKKIIAEQGEEILGDPQRLKAIFKDYAKNELKEQRLAFGRCIEIGAYNELKIAGSAKERQRKKAMLSDQLLAKAEINKAQGMEALNLLEAAVFGETQKKEYSNVNKQIEKAKPNVIAKPVKYSPNTPVYKIMGDGDELVVYENKLTITPKGFSGFINKGIKGTKTIPFYSITAIHFKKAGFFLPGYLQFSLMGDNKNSGGFFDEESDENTFNFIGKPGENEIAEEIKNYIERKAHEARSPNVKTESTADELAKLYILMEKGIISEDDFNRAKEKIL